MKTTPFHARTAALNETMLWSHWSGYAASMKYQHSEKFEYFAVRNAVTLFDTSPLFKYRIAGPDATRYLATLLARDIRTCAPGRAQYTIWCDQRGFLLEDGVILHVQEGEYWLTAARPNLRYFQDQVHSHNVTIEDISDRYAMLALQGPHAHNVLQQLSKVGINLPYFGLTRSQICSKPVLISRTGYTGDLGYEIWMDVADALLIWDSLMAAGAGYNIIPIGLTALSMVRIEAGMLMIDIDFESSRHAWIDDQCATPLELGFHWMFRQLEKDDRTFIGRSAIEQALAGGSSRWRMVGLALDWRSYERAYNDLGLLAPKDHRPIEEAMSLYDLQRSYLGYVTSFMYSPLLKKHIGLGKVPPRKARPGSEMTLEIMVNHRPKYVLARVVPLPFFNPPRKTAVM